MKTLNKIIIATVLFCGLVGCSGNESKIVKTEEFEDHGFTVIRATMKNESRLLFVVQKNNPQEVEVYSDYDQTLKGNLVIPEKVTCNKTTYKVTSIGEEAFEFSDFTSVNLPNSITELGEGAFGHCKRLSSVIIQNPNLKYDYDKVFYGCDNLQPQNVVYETKGSNMSVHEGSLSPSASSQSIPTSQPQKVYSNAYDGFVNIRQAPQSNAPIVGMLRNGPEGAILLDTEGEWKKINCNGIVGYVFGKYVQDTPTEVFHGE